MAASLLNEDLGTAEASGKKKKRRRNKKKDVAAPNAASVEEVSAPKESSVSAKDSSSAPAKESQSAKTIQSTSKSSQSTSKTIQSTSKSSQTILPKPSPSTPAISPSLLQPANTPPAKSSSQQLPSPKPKKVRPDIQRITRFLLGERREKTDAVMLPDRKHSLSPDPETPFVSLRQVLQRNDPLTTLLENSEPLLSAEEETMVLPPTDAVINQLVIPVQQKEEQNEYAIPPSQLLQQTLQESMEWMDDPLKVTDGTFMPYFADACSD